MIDSQVLKLLLAIICTQIVVWLVIQHNYVNVLQVGKDEDIVPPVNPERIPIIKPSNEKKLSVRIDNKVATSPFPDACSAQELDVIYHQLPPDSCKSFVKRPWFNKCSFSYATRCPDPVWIEDYYKNHYPSNVKVQKTTAIYVGCNKGMDAVNTLRMISGHSIFDKTLWRDTLFHNKSVHPGHCNQEHNDQWSIPVENGNTVFDSQVFCIEAMPNSAQALDATATKLGWQDKLHVVNAAMSSTDGSVYFPQTDGEIGTESLGISSCQSESQRTSSNCKLVKQYTLDTFLAEQQGPEIHFMSIDVEGFDWGVIMGGNKTLERTHYLEFEYNWKGMWQQHLLSDAIDELKAKGFVCYWAGARGNIWRITDCFLEHYNLKFWSNVACVNINIESAIPLYQSMERLFRETLGHGRAIEYKYESTANTDGRTMKA